MKWILRTVAALLVLVATARAQFINTVQSVPGTTSVVISWSTSSPTGAYVKYGLSPTSLTSRYPASGTVATGAVTLTELSSSTVYYYRITATDSLKQSCQSTLYQTTTMAHSVSLSWTESQTVASFNVYRDSGLGMVLLNSTLVPSYEDKAVALGQTYTYTVTAVDALGQESAPSGSAAATIPAN